MSWAKISVKNRNPASEGQNSGISQSKNPPKAAEAVKYVPSPKPQRLPKKEIWQDVKIGIISYAPVMIPLVYLPVIDTKGSPGILCSGTEIYITDKFWELPFDDIMYMTVFEFTQVLLGHRLKIDINITAENYDSHIINTEAEMIFNKVKNMLCNTLLLKYPGHIGVSPSLINPSEKLLKSVHQSFWGYTELTDGNNNNDNTDSGEVETAYIKYIDNERSLDRFEKCWSQKTFASVMGQLWKLYTDCKTKSSETYTDILYSISPFNYQTGSADMSNIPCGNFIINISAEQVKQIDNKLRQQESEPPMPFDEDVKGSGEAPGKGSVPSGGQNESSEDKNKSADSSSATPSESGENKKAAGSDSADSQNDTAESEYQSEPAASSDSGKDRNGEDGSNGSEDRLNSDDNQDGGFPLEYLPVLNKEKSTVSKDTYKKIIGESKRYLDESTLSYSLDSFGKRTLEIYNSLYNVSSAWWKKAQSMIMKYVPDVNSSYRRPNKKFAMSEFILPSQCEKALNTDVDKLRVFLDSSGSMTSEDFKIFKSLIKSAQNRFPKDTEAYEFNTAVTPMKCVNGKIIGSPAHTGGTDISCVTKFISGTPDKAKTLNIVVTDGEFRWYDLTSYMKYTDKMSKFLFIITKKGIDPRCFETDINKKRLQVLSVYNQQRMSPAS